MTFTAYTNGTTTINATVLDRTTLDEVMAMAMDRGYLIGGALGALSLSGPIHLTINGVEVPEGHWVFERTHDGKLGTFAPEKLEGYTSLGPAPALNARTIQDAVQLASTVVGHTPEGIRRLRGIIAAADKATRETDAWLWADEAIAEIAARGTSDALWHKLADNLERLLCTCQTSGNPHNGPHDPTGGCRFEWEITDSGETNTFMCSCAAPAATAPEEATTNG